MTGLGSRRGLRLIGLTVVVATAGISCSPAADSVGTQVAMDFTALQNGTAVSHFDDGRPATLFALPDEGSQMYITNGRLTFQPTTSGSAAAYLTTPDLGASVKSIRARFVFRPGADTDGAIGLVVSQGVGTDGGPRLIKPIPVHFVLTPTYWNVGVTERRGDPIEVIANGALAQPLDVDGATPYEARLTIESDRVEVDVAGTHAVVTDPRIAAWEGNFATFELYSNHGLVDSVAAFEEIWASAAD